ncbi:chromatin target of PRMT1 protein-like isoform X2 [Leptidea sinapis]|uniref:chromatin target of PRMT1 protein-like isoform X2 n=1 Tax=Leptidea sinapis TaxID=189913 RepID=UPI0021C3DB96|nr:chromatin target of PRMT1 protein-like isoform X2 [Leptidea sinapis]
MVIDKVYGLQRTGLSLNQRFTLLAQAQKARQTRPRRNSNIGYQNLAKQRLIEQLNQEGYRQAVKERLGWRSFGSDSNLPGLRRANSFGNLSQRSVTSGVPQRRKRYFYKPRKFNFFQGGWRNWGLQRRGGRMGFNRGRIRGRGGFQQVGRMQSRQAGAQNQGQTRVGPQNQAGARPQTGPRGRGRGRSWGRGANTNRPQVSKEELDLQLDQYMSSTKSALDKELDDYMKAAMELE